MKKKSLLHILDFKPLGNLLSQPLKHWISYLYAIVPWTYHFVKIKIASYRQIYLSSEYSSWSIEYFSLFYVNLLFRLLLSVLRIFHHEIDAIRLTESYHRHITTLFKLKLQAIVKYNFLLYILIGLLNILVCSMWWIGFSIFAECLMGILPWNRCYTSLSYGIYLCHAIFNWHNITCSVRTSSSLANIRLKDSSWNRPINVLTTQRLVFSSRYPSFLQTDKRKGVFFISVCHLPALILRGKIISLEFFDQMKNSLRLLGVLNYAEFNLKLQMVNVQEIKCYLNKYIKA